MARQFQFSLWNLLTAMFWLSVGGGSFAVLWSLGVNQTKEWPDWLLVVVAVSTYILTVVSPFIAVGILFGRARTGAIVGGIAVLVLGWLLLPGIQ
jgi:hypothetical protein